MTTSVGRIRPGARTRRPDRAGGRLDAHAAQRRDGRGQVGGLDAFGRHVAVRDRGGSEERARLDAVGDHPVARPVSGSRRSRPAAGSRSPRSWRPSSRGTAPGRRPPVRTRHARGRRPGSATRAISTFAVPVTVGPYAPPR